MNRLHPFPISLATFQGHRKPFPPNPPTPRDPYHPTYVTRLHRVGARAGACRVENVGGSDKVKILADMHGTL